MNSIQTLMLRARRYWFVDGIWESSLGLVFLANGMAFLMLIVMPNTFIYPLVLILLLSGIAGPFLIRRLKASITYPRTGYAGSQPPLSPGVRRGVLLVQVVGVAFGWLTIPAAIFLPRLTAGQPEFRAAINMIPLFVGMILPFVAGVTLAGILFSWGRAYRIERFYPLAAFSALLGTGLSLSATVNGFHLSSDILGPLLNVGRFWGDMFSSLFNLVIYFTLMGLALLGSGLIAFRAYLRQHPAPMEEAR